MVSWGGGVAETWNKAFAPDFEEQTGLDVEVVEVPNPEAQIRSFANNPVYNAGILSYYQAAKLANDGLIETFDDADIPELANIPEAYKLRAEDGRLVGIPVYTNLYGIAYNGDYVDEGAIKSWMDLGGEEWKNRIAITQPLYSSAYHLTILAIANGGSEYDIEPGLEPFRKQADNAAVVYTSLAQLNQLLTRGEVAAAPYYSARIWALRKGGASNIHFVIPEEGGLQLPYMLVVPKGSGNRDAILKWLNYSASAEPQVKASSIGGYIPVNDNAVLPEDVESNFGMSVENLKKGAVSVDWLEIARQNDARIELVEKIIAGEN
jgi:putative spermidine/putrescine transport system substrate-binding protein